MKTRPTQLSLNENGDLVIQWNDHTARIYTVKTLRDSCPCATCREKRSAASPEPLLPVLSAAETQRLTIVGMKPVGSYAYSIAFSDGHDTGIYTLEHLLQLVQPS